MRITQLMSRILVVALAPFLALFGLSACGETCPEYGVPEHEFDIEGFVLTTDGTPIQGISVAASECWSDTAAISDAAGHWRFFDDSCSPNFANSTARAHMTATDIDEFANGGYFEQTTELVVLFHGDLEICEWDWDQFWASGVSIVMEPMVETDAGTDDDIDGGTE